MLRQVLKIRLSIFACFLLLLSTTSVKGQDIFEEVKYEPALIKYDGLLNSIIQQQAEKAFTAIKNYHSKTAEELFDSILLLDNHNVLGVYGLAYCKFADGDYENSIEILSPIININTKNGALYSLRGRNYMVLENLEKAIDDFKKAIEYSADEKDMLSLSECLFYSGDFTASLLEADHYISKQSAKPEGYFVKGLAKSELKEYQLSNDELNKVIQLDAENSVAFYFIARNFSLLKETNKALKNCSKAIEYDSKNSAAFDLRAEMKYANHDYQNSIIDCNRVIELDSDTRNAYLTRGKSYLKIGLKKEACKDFKKSLELGNKNAEEFLTKSCN